MSFKHRQDKLKRSTNGVLVSTLLAGLLAISGTASAATQSKATQKTASTQKANTKKVNTKKADAKLKKTVTDEKQGVAETGNTLQQKIEDEDGELLATQPGQVAVSQATEIEMADEENEDSAVADIATQTTENHSSVDTTPTLAGETGSNIEATPITLQQKIKDKRGELQATQPGQVEIQENRHYRTQ